MQAPNYRANNRLIFPPTLRLLPLWTLGAAMSPSCKKREASPRRVSKNMLTSEHSTPLHLLYCRPGMPNPIETR